MILLQRWSGRIMSEPLGKTFFHQNTLFSGETFFQFFHVILKLTKQLTDFSKLWTLKKKNTCHCFIIFKMPMKELKTFNLSYHFL